MVWLVGRKAERKDCWDGKEEGKYAGADDGSMVWVRRAKKEKRIWFGCESGKGKELMSCVPRTVVSSMSFKACYEHAVE